MRKDAIRDAMVMVFAFAAMWTGVIFTLEKAKHQGHQETHRSLGGTAPQLLSFKPNAGRPVIRNSTPTASRKSLVYYPGAFDEKSRDEAVKGPTNIGAQLTFKAARPSHSGLLSPRISVPHLSFFAQNQVYRMIIDWTNCQDRLERARAAIKP